MLVSIFRQVLIADINNPLKYQQVGNYGYKNPF